MDSVIVCFGECFTIHLGGKNYLSEWYHIKIKKAFHLQWQIEAKRMSKESISFDLSKTYKYLGKVFVNFAKSSHSIMCIWLFHWSWLYAGHANQSLTKKRKKKWNVWCLEVYVDSSPHDALFSFLTYFIFETIYVERIQYKKAFEKKSFLKCTHMLCQFSFVKDGCWASIHLKELLSKTGFLLVTNYSLSLQIDMFSLSVLFCGWPCSQQNYCCTLLPLSLFKWINQF